MRRWWLGLLLVFGMGLGAWWLRPQAAGSEPAASLISQLSAPDTAGYARAEVPGAIVFPDDLGAHPDYRTEWWYYTGNLATSEGRPFGFELAIFRSALTPVEAEGSSAWRTNQVYLAHFAVSDIGGGQFFAAERFSRGAAGLAGATAVPYRVWLEDWSVAEQADGRVRLQAATEEVALDLYLTQTLPPVLHGDRGLSQKGPERGNASYYYSFVQQTARGTVAVSGEQFEVAGKAWKDHEYSTSALSEGAVGWDWFSLQFEDGTALMFFQIRREDGTLEPFSSGTFINADGTTVPIELADWEMVVTDTWRSPASGGEYPAGWEIAVDKLDLELRGAPLLADQELRVSTTYWEGATAFQGSRDGEPVTAVGYVEMTGYADTAIPGTSQ